MSYMQEFLPVIKNPMVVFTSTEDYPLLSELRGDLPATFKVFDSVWDLEPAREFKSVIQQQFVDHPEWAEGKGCTAPICSAVWNSKPWMVAQVAADNPYNSTYFMWVDIGSFRWGKHSLRNWPDVHRVQELAQHSTKIALGVVDLPAAQTIFGEFESHFVSGNWFGGTQAAIVWFAEAFSDVLKRRHALGLYIFQEQAMMNSLLLMQPDKFVVLRDHWLWVNGPSGLELKRAYDTGRGSIRCSVVWYTQFQVQLASEDELRLHTNTVGCQRVPYQFMQPLVTQYSWLPASAVHSKMV